MLSVCLYQRAQGLKSTRTASLTAQHVVIRVVCDRVDVRRRLGAPLALVGSDHRGGVDGQPLVWIHRHTEESGVGLRKEERARSEPKLWCITCSAPLDSFRMAEEQQRRQKP